MRNIETSFSHSAVIYSKKKVINKVTELWIGAGLAARRFEETKDIKD